MAEPRSTTPLVALRPLPARVLAIRTIARVDDALAASWKLPDGMRSLGLITCTSDDALYVALDAGTKAAPVEVVYARSFYAGAAHASGPLSGEVMGAYAGTDPDEVQAALEACVRCLEDEAMFYAADELGTLAIFPHVVRSTGRWLAREASVEVGAPIAYLIAPPLESMIGLDAAMKAAPVSLQKWFGPPTETNFGGAYLTGTLADCEAAARAFAAAIVDVARAPIDLHRSARGAGEEPGARPAGKAGGRFVVLATGERLADKPEHLTHLRDDASLVGKGHPRMLLRGKLDTLQGALLDAQVAADAASASGLVGDLGEALELVRRMVGAEVMDRPLGPFTLGGLDAGKIRWASHHTHELYRVPFMYPSVRQGAPVAKLALARALAREAELAFYVAFENGAAPSNAPPYPEAQADLALALNRLSSALYLMQVRYVGGAYGKDDERPIGPIRGWQPAKS
jgi:ethanolamine utilization protein EutL